MILFDFRVNLLTNGLDLFSPLFGLGHSQAQSFWRSMIEHHFKSIRKFSR